MASPLIFHYREGTSLLSRANPLSKLCSLCALSIVLSFSPLMVTLGVLAVILLAMARIHLPLGQYHRELVFFLFMGLLIIVTEYLSTASWPSSLAATFRFLDFILLGMLFADTTDIDDLGDCLAVVFDKIPHVHGGRIASTVTMSLSLVPLVFDISNSIMDAQTARGCRRKRPISFLVTFILALADSLFPALDDFSDSLDARLFDPDRKRKCLPFGSPDLILLLTVTAMTVIGSMAR